MRRVVPSIVAAFIEHEFKDVIEGQHDQSPRDPGIVAGLLRLIDHVPSDLISLEMGEFAQFVKAVEQLRISKPEWMVLNNAKLGAIKTIHALLQKCPDEAASTDTNLLSFISDADLRGSLRIDLSEASRAVEHGEWKSATVLAGSIAEALLLWSLQNLGGLPADADSWGIEKLLKRATEKRLITQRAEKAIDQARHFRNLIHPGRAQRLGERCTRGTALLALGAVEVLADELAKLNQG